MDKGRPSLPSALVLVGRAPGQDMDAGHGPASERALFQRWGPPSPSWTLGSSFPAGGAGQSVFDDSISSPPFSLQGRCSLPLSGQGLVGPPSASHSGPLSPLSLLSAE